MEARKDCQEHSEPNGDPSDLYREAIGSSLDLSRDIRVYMQLVPPRTNPLRICLNIHFAPDLYCLPQRASQRLSAMTYSVWLNW
jgi:hypothetical protein